METGGAKEEVVRTYAVVIEGDGTSFSAYAPDLPGCVAAGDSPEEVRKLMQEAIPLHVNSLREHGEPIPLPHTRVEYIDSV